MDNAISEFAAKHKKVSGPVAGKPDILIVQNIEAGNILIKALTHLSGRRAMGLLVGAKAPVVLTSRTNNEESKCLSIARAVFMVNRTRELWLKVDKVHYREVSLRLEVFIQQISSNKNRGITCLLDRNYKFLSKSE